KAQAFGDRRKEMLKDIAAITGATLISEEVGLKLDAASFSDLGEARKVVSGKDKTVIVEGKGKPEAVEARISEIKVALDKTKSDFDKEKLAERLAKLSGGVGIIKVGAATEVELKEKKMRIEDALNATKAAVEEGIVAGGGASLLHASTVLENFRGDSDEMTGAKIVLAALSKPLWQIAENAGQKGDVIVAQVKAEGEKNKNMGWDAAKGEIVDMFERGIVDPKKVSRSALQNAASVAGIVLTTGAAVTDLPEDKKDPMAGMGGMGGMDMM
ncbi:MAG: TCP-1/cpn60 chaperonin family protein, partial [Patescibacteria group bacterium]